MFTAYLILLNGTEGYAWAELTCRMLCMQDLQM